MDEVVLKLLGLLEQLVEERGVPKKEAAIDKNIVKSPNSPLANGKKQTGSLNSFEKKRLTESFTLFNKLFFDYKKKMEPDTVAKAKVSEIAKKQVIPPPIPQKKEGKSGFSFSSILAGLSLFGIGLWSFISGLMTDGPFKGILKLLSRFSLKAGIKLLSKAVKPFLEIAGKLLKTPMKFLGKIGKFLGEGFGKVGKFLFGDIAKIAGKMFGKIGGGSLGKMLFKFIKPLAKVFKRIPIIGTILSVAFAYSRFKSGDVVGGVIDVLSGLAGLVDIVLPGVGTAMSIGLDVLNAVLDSKADQGEGKPPKDKLTILKDMASSIGNWIWNNREYIPIMSSVNRFMMSWDAFKSGDISGGFENFGWAMASLVTGVDAEKVVNAFSGIMGLFSTKQSSGNKPKEDTSFLGEIGASISKTVMELWDWIKQKIKDGIAALIPGGKAAVEFAKSTAKSTVELTGFIGDKSKEAFNKTKSVVSNVWDNISKGTSKAFDKASSYVSDIYEDTYGKGTARPWEVKSKSESNNIEKHSINPQDILVKNNNKKMSDRLYYLNMKNNEYLRIIANNTSMLLRKSSAGGESVGNTTIVMSPQSTPTQMINIPNNRDGYISSAYSLG